jgi:hypothetical protein
MFGGTFMLRDYWEPSLPTAAIGLLSFASGGDTFRSLHAEFHDLPNGVLAALCIAAALRISFFLFADGAARDGISWWFRGGCLAGVAVVLAASAASGVLPASTMSPIERMTLDGVILALIGFKNATVARAPADGRGSGSRAPPPDAEPSTANALELIDLLDRYAVEELGGIFLYVPRPEPRGRPRLQPWILLLQARNVIKHEPWVVYPDGIRAKVLKNYPQILDGAPTRFYIYRLDREALSRLMASL